MVQKDALEDAIRYSWLELDLEAPRQFRLHVGLVPEDQIIPGSAKDNFWSKSCQIRVREPFQIQILEMGATGPCDPSGYRPQPFPAKPVDTGIDFERLDPGHSHSRRVRPYGGTFGDDDTDRIANACRPSSGAIETLTGYFNDNPQSEAYVEFAFMEVDGNAKIIATPRESYFFTRFARPYYSGRRTPSVNPGKAICVLSVDSEGGNVIHVNHVPESF
ncbi:hypothetical protein EI94DRAFT_1895574 [Lactarius quietus]|nr:hypothetical protein EI94DRAFT_1895574 [Lactarius quietus]